VGDVGVSENLFARLGGLQGAGEQKYAMLLGAAYAQPSIDPFNPDFEVKTMVMAQIGVCGPNGFQPTESDAKCIPLFGCCKGAFFAFTIVPCQPWPFRKIASGDPKYILRGRGMSYCRTVAQGGDFWRIVHYRRTTVIQNHFIDSKAQGGNVAPGPSFPGMPYPYALDDGTLDSGKPVWWKWLDAEAKFCPLIQAPDDLQP
jgi:hypothetical protein